MRNLADRLIRDIKKKRSYVVVGLDPRLELLPASFRRGANNAKKAAKTIERFNRAVIDIVESYAVAIKPQIAFYERWGHSGIGAFKTTCGYGQEKGLLVIGDVKRGDVPSTAEAYAEAYLGKNSPVVADAITVNPFFGTDSIEPFTKMAKKTGKGLFILVKTSNPSSAEIQDLRLDGKYLYEILAERTVEWGSTLIGKNGYSSVGAIVGATYPSQAKVIRAILQRNFILIPGYGAQGGKAEDLRHYFNPDGLGAIVSASRSITFAYRGQPYDKKYGERKWELAVEQAVKNMRDEVNSNVIKG
ncbi:MAG: orotidine 5'-phosphate decarboxylase [Planctomycetes bacterium RBG_16_43_13]|nr:MAG: orotidine 5'-phosphate decarboxylase [Planctomycetes bacterium RBG_16_43_13]